MEDVPLFIPLIFGATTLMTLFLFYKGAHKDKTTLLVLAVWWIVQTVLGLLGFYTVLDTTPPRFLLLILPPLLLIALLFATPKGRTYIDGLDSKTLTLLHTIRIPVELVLFWLFLEGTLPELMTFEGRNFDILAGLSAPLVYYFGFVKKKLSPAIMILWNLIALGLLINIVVNAILSAPLPFQQFAFDQPNIAVLHFPYNWLPACVVPLVLFSHLVNLRQLSLGKYRSP